MQANASTGRYGANQGVYKMTNRILLKRTGTIAVGSGFIAATIYFVMITITLAHIQNVSGQVPFDMRPSGYAPNEAVVLLQSLGVDGRNYYLFRQIPLDTLYPAMLALTLSATILWFGRRISNRRLIFIGVAVSICSAVFDYAENFGIVAMILSWPEVSVPLVHTVSTASVLKSVATTLAVMLVVLVGFKWMLQSNSKRSPIVG